MGEKHSKTDAHSQLLKRTSGHGHLGATQLQQAHTPALAPSIIDHSGVLGQPSLGAVCLGPTLSTPPVWAVVNLDRPPVLLDCPSIRLGCPSIRLGCLPVWVVWVVCPSVRPSVHPGCPSICLHCLPARPSGLSARPSVHLGCPSIRLRCLPVRPSIHLGCPSVSYTCPSGLSIWAVRPSVWAVRPSVLAVRPFESAICGFCAA